MKTYTDFSHNNSTYEAIGLTWDEVEEILGHEPKGTPDEDEKLVDWIVDHSEYSENWLGEGTVDEDGWYIFIKS